MTHLEEKLIGQLKKIQNRLYLIWFKFIGHESNTARMKRKFGTLFE